MPHISINAEEFKLAQLERKITVTTHDGLFHADEVFAIALIMYVFGQDVVVRRTRNRKVLAESLSYSNEYTIDVGSEYDPSRLNFDHHHMASAEASNMMLLAYFVKMELLEPGVYSALEPAFGVISKFDVGYDNVHEDWSKYHKEGYLHMNSMVRGFNRDAMDREIQDKQFKLAVSMAYEVIVNLVHHHLELRAQRLEAGKGVYLSANSILFDRFIPREIWTKVSQAKYAVMPHAEGAAVFSRDANDYKTPTTGEGLLFAHSKGFMSVYDTRKNLIEALANLVYPGRFHSVFAEVEGSIDAGLAGIIKKRALARDWVGAKQLTNIGLTNFDDHMGLLKLRDVFLYNINSDDIGI